MPNDTPAIPAEERSDKAVPHYEASPERLISEGGGVVYDDPKKGTDIYADYMKAVPKVIEVGAVKDVKDGKPFHFFKVIEGGAVFDVKPEAARQTIDIVSQTGNITIRIPADIVHQLKHAGVTPAYGGDYNAVDLGNGNKVEILLKRSDPVFIQVEGMEPVPVFADHKVSLDALKARLPAPPATQASAKKR